MRFLLAILLTPFVWILMNIISFAASFPLSWIQARSMTKAKAPKEIVSMVNNPVGL